MPQKLQISRHLDTKILKKIPELANLHAYKKWFFYDYCISSEFQIDNVFLVHIISRLK